MLNSYFPYHFTSNRRAASEIWMDMDLHRKHTRIVKLQKIKYKLKHGNTKGFEPKRPH